MSIIHTTCGLHNEILKHDGRAYSFMYEDHEVNALVNAGKMEVCEKYSDDDYSSATQVVETSYEQRRKLLVNNFSYLFSQREVKWR
jgi:hypothetical protein